MKKMYLDDEERDLVESIERGEWKSVRNLKAEIKKHQEYARNTLKKDKRVNIRISSRDLEAIQTRAVEDGIPYQTLMASVLHRFVAGRLKEA
ncbi:MAG: antitoxin [Verrucomicrobia bacterium]|jgi:predicted DNA binding CopG/RHH family protein|nr:antitoxin [Verrucomicrobiota bacterium]MBT7065110.1 antitoxin [Verrucomicrobiota bacterium]MBT7702430.1 antitoxin [Verrucomicrobiota bacterium]